MHLLTIPAVYGRVQRAVTGILKSICCCFFGKSKGCRWVSGQGASCQGSCLTHADCDTTNPLGQNGILEIEWPSSINITFSRNWAGAWVIDGQTLAACTDECDDPCAKCSDGFSGREKCDDLDGISIYSSLVETSDSYNVTLGREGCDHIDGSCCNMAYTSTDTHATPSSLPGAEDIPCIVQGGSFVDSGETNSFTETIDATLSVGFEVNPSGGSRVIVKLAIDSGHGLYPMEWRGQGSTYDECGACKFPAIGSLVLYDFASCSASTALGEEDDWPSAYDSQTSESADCDCAVSCPCNFATSHPPPTPDYIPCTRRTNTITRYESSDLVPLDLIDVPAMDECGIWGGGTPSYDHAAWGSGAYPLLDAETCNPCAAFAGSTMGGFWAGDSSPTIGSAFAAFYARKGRPHSVSVALVF